MANEKVAALLNDKNFCDELSKATSAEQAQRIFASRGADISVDELKAIRAKLKQEAGEQLTDEELALVAGGVSGASIAQEVKGFVKEIFSGW